MRSVLLLLLIATTASAAAEPLEVKCLECRDPHIHPRDYGNFAYNQVFGPQAWVTGNDRSRLKITNLDDRWAVVELDHKLAYTPLTFSVGFITLDFVTLTPEIEISVYADTGLFEQYPTIPSGSEMIVGPPPERVMAPPSYDEYTDAPILDSTGSGGGSFIYNQPTTSYPGMENEGIVIVGPSY